MHKSLSGPCIPGNKNLRIVIGHSLRGGPITMRKFPFPRIHGPDHDLCIRSMPCVVLFIPWPIQEVYKVLKFHHLPFSLQSLHLQLYLQHQPELSADLHVRHKYYFNFCLVQNPCSMYSLKYMTVASNTVYDIRYMLFSTVFSSNIFLENSYFVDFLLLK